MTRVIHPWVNRLLPVAHANRSDPACKTSETSLCPRDENYYWTGGHEPRVANPCKVALRGDVFLGCWSVTSFEPVPVSFARLQTSIELKGANILVPFKLPWRHYRCSASVSR
jgi:hypothetical protein